MMHQDAIAHPAAVGMALLVVIAIVMLVCGDEPGDEE